MNRLQKKIIKELNVDTGKCVEELVLDRSEFLSNYRANTSATCYVLGISGGVDSFVAAMLVKEAGVPLATITLPYGDQKDLMDSMEALGVINPQSSLHHNIKQSVDTTFDSLMLKIGCSPEKANLIKANIMARERMNVQYAYASGLNGLVVGTDHATEAVVWYFTKYGDGAADITPLAGLLKDDIYKLAEYFNAPKCILKKAPSAGLWDGQTDETELGITYAVICKYLRGEKVAKSDGLYLEQLYRQGYHKSQPPVAITDKWWKQ